MLNRGARPEKSCVLKVLLGKAVEEMIKLIQWLAVAMALAILPGCQAALRTLPTAEMPPMRPFCPGGMCPAAETSYLSPAAESQERPSLSLEESQSLEEMGKQGPLGSLERNPSRLWRVL